MQAAQRVRIRKGRGAPAFVSVILLDHVVIFPEIFLMLLPQTLAHQIAETKDPKQRIEYGIPDRRWEKCKGCVGPVHDSIVNEWSNNLHCTHRNAPPQKIPQDKSSMSSRADLLPVLSL